MQIKHKLTGDVLLEIAASTLRFANLCGADLRDADLRDADLRDADLRDADLRDADLRGANLGRADLCGANLRDADLRDADLCDADLCDADLCGANLRFANLPYVPPVPDLDAEILKRISQEGCELKMDNWHTCATTHCRAGWAITISPVGKTLESIFGAAAAGALIYHASYPTMKVPDFYCPNADAMNDIRRRAALAK